MEAIVNNTIHIAVALLVPPVLVGVINKIKAVFAGRVGPPLLQPYYDILKLLQKGTVFSTTTTWVFRAGPIVGLVTTVLALMLIPLGGAEAPLSFTGDVVLLVYLFGLGRFFTTSAALDTGSPFEGMGATREVTFACLAEPALMLGLVVLAQLSASVQLGQMLGPAVAGYWPTAGASLALVLVSWFIVLLVENCRVPFDDPNTHLELTMIHEVMVLDHSGPAFGLILYGAALKLFALSALIVHLGLSVHTGLPWLDWPVFLGGTVGVAVLVGVVESTMARLRLTHLPLLLVAACLLPAFAVILVIR
jgi:formate hydrogenlyase subunit 4